MNQLRRTYGPGVRFILFLCGYFDSGYLGYEAAEGIDWVWEHRIGEAIRSIPSLCNTRACAGLVESLILISRGGDPGIHAGEEPRPPRVERQKLTIRRAGVLAQPLSIGESVKADSVFKNASNVGNTPFRVFDEATALKTMTMCAAVWFAHTALFRLKSVQLTPMEAKRRDAHHTGVIGTGVSTSPPIRENPRVNTMGFKDFRQLPTGLLQPMRVPKLFGLIALLGLDTPELFQFAVEPILPNLKRRERTVPSPPTARVRLDILHHEGFDGK